MTDKQTMTRGHLAQAERHVAEGAVIVQRQRDIITELERDGHEVSAARALLEEFEATQALHVADRDRLRGELGRVKGDL